MNPSLQRIYFHVGISKTGSTFLQKRVFPLLSKINYIPTNRYQNIFLEIDKINLGNILISREFDRQFEKEVDKFSNKHPESIPIIVLRRHDEYFASQYRRFVKNGFTGNIEDFLNLKDDSGFFKKIHFNFKHQIDTLVKSFSQKPIVLFHQDLKSNPKKFVTNFCDYTCSSINIDEVNFSKKHGSYSEKQLKTIRFVAKYFNLRKRRVFRNPLLHIFWRFLHALARYGILYISFVLPNFLYSKEPLIDPLYLKEIKNYFKDDWENCLAYKNVKE
jgi:hypothetical protein